MQYFSICLRETYRSRTQRKHFREGRENVWKRSKADSEPTEQIRDGNTNADANPNPIWQPLVTESPNFEEYYKEQGIVGAEEWDTFMECLRTALPAAFRVNASSLFYLDIRSQLENDFMKSLQAEDCDGNEVEAIRPLPWYPENLAWQSNFSRKQLRRNETLEKFHKFLKLENEIGNITRQEAVSMVPPLFLDVRPDHFILDMCAAPGSKTFQLLEMIHRSMPPDSLPTGMVVANDVDIQRCNLLIHQTKRMCTANLVVTTHEAQHFPSCHLNKNYVNTIDAGNMKKPEMSQLLFDRVLCDVPCSGDGTLRKAPDIWRKWNAGMGNGLHGLQILIAMRGLSLLKVGGRMVYSTCSMNPVENEAVVAEILRRCQGTVELVDVSNELPQLIRRSGLKTWKVRDRGEWLACYKDVTQNRRAAVVPGMFPSGKAYDDPSDADHDTTAGKVSENTVNGKPETTSPSEEDHVQAIVPEEEISDLPLERCMRIVPHDQNTGAFFIAVFHKLSPLPAVQKKSSSSSGHNKPQTEEAKTEVKDVDMITVKSGVARDDQLSEATPGVGMQVPETSASSVSNGDRTVRVDLKTENETVEMKDVDTATAVNADVNVGQSSEATVGVVLEVEATSDAISDDKTTREAKEMQSSDNNRTGSSNVGGKRKLQIQGKWIGVDPVIFYNDEAIMSKIKEFYGIQDSIPFSGHLVTRNSDTSHVKRIYYVSGPVKDVLELNLRAGQPLKIASVGLKMFERQTSKEGTSSPCAFRISSEGLPLLLPHMTKQILYASLIDFKHLLQYKSIKFKDFTDAEFVKKASELMLGCCVVVLRKDNQMDAEPHQVDPSTTIAIGCWRGKNSISVMVTAVDCQELLERLLKGTEAENPSALEVTKPSFGEPNEVMKTNDSAETKEETEVTATPALG